MNWRSVDGFLRNRGVYYRTIYPCPGGCVIDTTHNLRIVAIAEVADAERVLDEYRNWQGRRELLVASPLTEQLTAWFSRRGVNVVVLEGVTT